MTVEQLIAELQKLPNPQLPVFVENGFDPSDREELSLVDTRKVDCQYMGALNKGDEYIYLST